MKKKYNKYCYTKPAFSLKIEEELTRKREERMVWKKILEPDSSCVWWCSRCRIGIMERKAEKDYSPQQELVMQCWKCDKCGKEEYEPFD